MIINTRPVNNETCIGLLVLAAFVFCPSAVADPLVWFSPLDHLLRPEVKYGGAPSYMELFAADAPWSKAVAHVSVFKIYPQWITRASDDRLDQIGSCTS